MAKELKLNIGDDEMELKVGDKVRIKRHINGVSIDGLGQIRYNMQSKVVTVKEIVKDKGHIRILEDGGKWVYLYNWLEPIEIENSFIEEQKLLTTEEEEIKLIKATLELKIKELESQLPELKVGQEVWYMGDNQIKNGVLKKIEVFEDGILYAIGNNFCWENVVFNSIQELINYLIKESEEWIMKQ